MIFRVLDYSFNNFYHSPVNVTDVIPQQFVVEFRTNNYPSHNSYNITDDAGNIVGTYLDEYFLSIDVKRTVKQFYDPNNPFDLRVADRV